MMQPVPARDARRHGRDWDSSDWIIGCRMCLACELDALWYAEWERLAAEGPTAAGSPGTAGDPPALSGDAGLPPASGESIENEVPARGEATGGTPEVPGLAVPRPRFRCEEAE
jgi:hypothetical protein